MFKIEGPATFYRFAAAAITGQLFCLLVGLVFLIRDRRNGWPYLLAGAFFFLNDLIRLALTKFDLMQALTEFVGSRSLAWTFIGSFALMLGALIGTGVHRGPKTTQLGVNANCEVSL